MKKDFRIFDLPMHFEMCDFINCLSRQGKKFNITPHLNPDNTNGGFVVWYYI